VPNWVVHRLPIGRGLHWTVAPLLLPLAIRRVHAATRFELLRVHSLRYIGPAALIARRRYRLEVPIVAHHHHLDRSRLNPWIERRVMLAVERVITVSRFSARQATDALGVPEEKLAVVYNGVDAKFRPGRKPDRLLQRFDLFGKPVVLFLGGLKSRKNLFMLLEVWREVVRERPDARLVIAGAGPLEPALRRRAARATPPGSVSFAGYVPEAEKVDYYRVADLFVSTSALEGFGFTVAEAMACGLPVVVSNRGALPEIVEGGQGGVLCDPNDLRAFSRSVLDLLADGTVRERFGAANRERVQRLFSWELCARDVRRVYEDVLAAWRRRQVEGAARV